MRQKYIDEKVGVWFIFGTSSDTPGLVDISDGTNIPEAQANFRAALYTILENH